MKTTNADFVLFQKECQKWIDELGLHEWEIYYMHEDIGDYEAEMTPLYESKVVYIKLNIEISDDVGMTKNQYIKMSALEEVIHVLLSNLWHYAEKRNFVEEAYRAEEHSVIHRLQKVLT